MTSFCDCNMTEGPTQNLVKSDRAGSEELFKVFLGLYTKQGQINYGERNFDHTL